MSATRAIGALVLRGNGGNQTPALQAAKAVREEALAAAVAAKQRERR